MARWRLKATHYLMVRGVQWENKETDGLTGKVARKLYDVPQLLDPKEPADHNYPGEIIVADRESRQYEKDYVFKGPPTPDMEPLDDEAEKISERYRKHWTDDPFAGSAGPTYSEQLLEKMNQQLDALARRPEEPSQVVALQKQVDDLKKLVESLTKQKVA